VQVARVWLITALRERETLFWSVVFPLLLLSLFTLIFGRLGREGEMNFTVALANLDQGPGGAGGLTAVVEEVFLSLSVAPEEGKEPLFTVRRPAAGDDVEEFIARQAEAVRLGELAVLIVIPTGFEAAVWAGFAGGPGALLRVYTNEASAASGMAARIVEQVLAGVNRQLLIQAGLFRAHDAVPTQTSWVGGGDAPVAYVDYLLPGIVLMAFFTGGLFGVPGTILFSRDMKILRRYWVTPLGVSQYFAGFSLGYLAMCALQFALLWVVGRFAFGATLHFAQPLVVVYLALSAVTFFAFGFLVASLAKTAQAGMAIASIINLPMMFLGGLFFPVAEVPLFLRVILYLNPLTYLAEGLRSSLGIAQGVLPLALTFVVPLAWIVLSAGVAGRRLRWDVGR
jgi:ABC-2 type transport system permease protein